jgi:hypothetical protein
MPIFPSRDSMGMWMKLIMRWVRCTGARRSAFVSRRSTQIKTADLRRSKIENSLLFNSLYNKKKVKEYENAH